MGLMVQVQYINSILICTFQWVMGSSSLSSLQEMLLELDLTTAKGDMSGLVENRSTQQGRIRIELTRDNVSTLINVLEKAQESL